MLVRTGPFPSNLSFEPVAQAHCAALYATDDQQPLAAVGNSASLTVPIRKGKADAKLDVAGDKRYASGYKLASGATVVATVTSAKCKVVVARITGR